MEKKYSNEQYPKRKKESETFLIKVSDNQHGTWQGKIIWADEDKTTHFRSTLELLKLMDEVVSEGTMMEKDYYQRKAT